MASFPWKRFESLTEKGKILSLSVFRDEAAVAAWRNVQEHRRTQGKGRASIFRNYRLRIAGVIRDYGMNDREQAPKDSAPLTTRTSVSKRAWISFRNNQTRTGRDHAGIDDRQAGDVPEDA